MIGREIYPAATFGFSITFSTVLHLGHIMVLPWYPSSAILKVTVCLSFGSPLYINVLPQSGTGQRAMGMRFILLSIYPLLYYPFVFLISVNLIVSDKIRWRNKKDVVEYIFLLIIKRQLETEEIKKTSIRNANT